MTTDDQLGELLVEQNLMTVAQLHTALEFQRNLGGSLRNIVVKLGYVKDSVLAGLVAQEENVGSSLEITGEMLCFDSLRTIPREVLEKHQVVPLRSDGQSLVLAMADPNNLTAIEEIQFLCNRRVEPAVATKAAIRKTLNQLHELVKAHETKSGNKKVSLSPDRVKAIRDQPVDKLIRAYLVIQIEKGALSIEDLLARANKL